MHILFRAHKRMASWFLIAWMSGGLVAITVGLGACTDANRNNRFGTMQRGESCKRLSDCYAGLQCDSSICVPVKAIGGSGPHRGDPCTSDNQCPAGNTCGTQGRCTTRPAVSAGGVCVLDIDCATGLVCNGVSNTCTQDTGNAGTYDLGHACSELQDCRRPYLCGIENTCSRLPLFTGSLCERSDLERGSFRVYFEVPPDVVTSEDKLEFYRLPFPSDVRVHDGHISLQGHQSPGDVLGVNIKDTYFTPVEEDATGFAVNGSVFFNFSDKVDYRTICANTGSVYPTIPDPEDVDLFCDSSMTSSTLMLVDVDSDSVHYGEWVPIEINASRAKNQYICQNWMGVAPLAGKPLQEGTTYALLILKGIKSTQGKLVTRDHDFDIMLQATAPSDAKRPELAHAYTAMAPLRAWIAANSIDASLLVGASVFTTARNSHAAERVRAAVQALPTPTFSNNAMVCGQDLTQLAPCDDRYPFGSILHQRGCFGPADSFYEIQGTYKNPIFQQGTRPYRQVSQGGAFVWSNDLPVKQGEEDLCYAMTVPKNVAMPAGGWPVVMYSHGTDGSYREFIGSPGTPSPVVTALTNAGYAVIGIDNVSHGRRQGNNNPLTWSSEPGNLFFNIFNPRASRDNILQGSADLFHLTRLLRNANSQLNMSLSMGNVTASVKFDSSKVYFLGHSQGSVISPGFITYEQDLKGVALSGAGGELALSILNKKNPTDLSIVAGSFFGDRSLHRIHPIMNILAIMFGPAESMTYAPYMVRDRIGSTNPIPYLQFSGVGDTYTPDVTQQALIRAVQVPFVGYVAQSVSGVERVQGNTAQANVTTTSGVSVTGGAVQYAPATGSNGHFVLFEVPGASTTLGTFFNTARTQAQPLIQR